MPRPNILFFFPDQHRGDWLGNSPSLPLRTPNLDRLMHRGIEFTRAYTPSPLCAPARACLASGRDYSRCRVPNNHVDYPLDLPTYYQALRDVGYRVAGVGKFDLHKDTSDPSNLDWGLDGTRCLRDWGFTEGIDNEGKLDGSTSYRVNSGPKGPYLAFLHQRGLAEAYVQEHADSGTHRSAYVTALPDDAYCDNWLSENGLDIIRRFPAGQPWHMVVNFTGPHGPMDVTRTMHDAWKDVSFPPPHRNDQARFSAADHQRNRQHYAAMIENIDRQIGRFIDLLEQRDELARTLIVYCSDHGEMLGDHGRWGKNVYYEPSVRVPLIIAGPGVRSDVRSDALVSVHDLAATSIEFADARPLPEMESRSLGPLLRGECEAHRDTVHCGLNQWRAAVNARFKLVTGVESDPILHDLERDPLEDVNVAENHPEAVAELLNMFQLNYLWLD